MGEKEYIKYWEHINNNNNTIYRNYYKNLKKNK